MSSSSWKTRALVQLTLLRVREFMREPEALFWTLIFPILITTGLGVAFRNQPAEILKVAAVEARVSDALKKEPLLDVDELPREEALAALRTGSVVLVVEQGAGGVVTYHYDDTNPQARAARAVADHAVQIAGGRLDPVSVSDALLREPGSRYIDFLVPGLVAIGIMSNSMWGLGFGIVDARRRKLMKRLVATPMPRQTYLLSYLAWRLLLLPFEVGVPVGFGVLAFGVPVRGSLAEMILFCVLGSLAFSALGLLLASRARTIEAISGIMNVVMLPMWIVCGVFFSADRFPDTVQPLIRILPLTALIDGLRANMLQGKGIETMGLQVTALGVCLAVCFALAMKLFRWK